MDRTRDRALGDEASRGATRRSATDLVCAGDSNSITEEGWCGLLAARLPPDRWRVVNVSIFGIRARGWLASKSVDRLIRQHEPDVVFFALGTNDVCDTAPEVVVAYLLALAGQAARLCPPSRSLCSQVILATIPPIFSRPPYPDCRPTIERTNALLRASWPSYLVADFDSWVTGREWYIFDGLHLNRPGQA